MIDGIEPFYQRIGESIQDAIGEDWSSAKMEAVFYSDSITFLGEYTRAVDGKPRSFATDPDGERAFRELRERFRDAGKQVWGQACFKLESDGSFKMEWGYENCDENGDTVFDENEELRRNEERRKRLTSG